MLTKRLVQNLGYAISTAESGVDALDKIKTTHFDLILTDIQMPLMNGLELAASIRKLEDEAKKHLPIIALTGYAGDDEVKEALNSGVNEILTKPFGPESLDLLIKKLIVV
jgi:CheY-like chemotaxis protein